MLSGTSSPLCYWFGSPVSADTLAAVFTFSTWACVQFSKTRFMENSSWFQNFKRNHYWCLRSKLLVIIFFSPLVHRCKYSFHLWSRIVTYPTMSNAAFCLLWKGTDHVPFIYSKKLEPDPQGHKSVECSYKPSGPRHAALVLTKDVIFKSYSQPDLPFINAPRPMITKWSQ